MSAKFLPTSLQTLMKHKNLVLTYCWDTEDLAQLEPRGTWYRKMHWWKSPFNNYDDVMADLVWLPWHAPCRWKPEGGHTTVVMETIRIPQHVDPTPGFFQKALTHKDNTGIHACIWINLHISTLKLTHVNTHTHTHWEKSQTFAFTRRLKVLECLRDTTSRQTSADDEGRGRTQLAAVVFHRYWHAFMWTHKSTGSAFSLGNCVLKDSMAGSIRFFKRN